MTINMSTLQNIILPSLRSYADPLLYFKANSRAQFSYEARTISLTSGGELDFATYFNQFSVTRWREYTDISSVRLEIEYEGEGLLTFSCQQLMHSPRVIAELRLENSTVNRAVIDLPSLDDLETGLLSFRVSTLGSFVFKSARFVTLQSPNRQSTLGIAITAFKRDQYVIPAVTRLHNDLLIADEYADRIRLCVVDNGHTLKAEDVPETCNIIRNQNYGGAGGFSRGLYHYDKESQGVTHCLFMDDDASCESEAIIRTIALLDFAADDHLAICGAMMLERLSYVQHEAGAVFDRSCRPMKHGLDLRETRALLVNDVVEEIGYGAWWYFAFPIKHVERYPFPYFVRGDDILFSMVNSFRIGSLNGVCSWQESFAAKSSPLTLYLDIRSHLCHYLLTDRLNYSVKELLSVFWYFFLKNNAAYHYATAEAVCVALEDFLKPASFWGENMDMAGKRRQLAPLVDAEKLVPLNPPAVAPLNLETPPGMLRRGVRWLTLNGHLVPSVFFKKNVTVTKEEAPFLRKSFLARSMTVYHYESFTGVVLKHNKRWFYSNLFRAIKLSVRLALNAKSLRTRTPALREYMTVQFWGEQFQPESSESSGA